MPYIFDTNCFIEGWHRTYTLKIMPDYWKLLAEDIVSGHIISPSQVKEEIYKKDDDLKTWMKKRQIVPKLLQEEKQQIENKVQEILKNHPENIKAFGNIGSRSLCYRTGVAEKWNRCNGGKGRQTFR